MVESSDAGQRAGLRRVRRGDRGGILEALDTDGAVIVEGFIPEETACAIAAELREHVERRVGGFRGMGEEFYGKNTVRVQGLAKKSETFVREVLVHEDLKTAADSRLLENAGSYWMSQAETIYIGPGEAAQPLHRDDLNWAVASRLGVDLQVSALVALGDYDEEVGATRVVPGSQKADWDGDRTSVAAEMRVGDAMIYTGRVLHGGGANKTADRQRQALYIGLIVSWLTPEEAVSTTLSADDVRDMSEEARRLLGWGVQRGNPRGTGVEHAEVLQLWQMDEDEGSRTGGAFIG